MTYWAKFGRFHAWRDWRDGSFLRCHITEPSAGTVGSRRFVATQTLHHLGMICGDVVLLTGVGDDVVQLLAVDQPPEPDIAWRIGPS
ncbi:MAG TPA: hypothetical protein VMY42_01910 [Thermoguttaceae bacterium]|nr:hypothetical protein [Thermoguttaceae bacterium]